MCVPKSSPLGYWIVSPADVQHLRGEAFEGGIQLMRRWFSHRRTLRAQSALDDRLIVEAGVSRTESEKQRAKPFRNIYARRHLK